MWCQNYVPTILSMAKLHLRVSYGRYIGAVHFSYRLNMLIFYFTINIVNQQYQYLPLKNFHISVQYYFDLTKSKSRFENIYIWLLFGSSKRQNSFNIFVYILFFHRNLNFFLHYAWRVYVCSSSGLHLHLSENNLIWFMNFMRRSFYV